MTKEELIEELKEVKKLYVVGIYISTSNWDRGLWKRFSIYYVKDNNLKRLVIDDDEKDLPTYYVPFHKTKGGNRIGGYFENDALGSDRVFDIVYSLGKWLFNDGYKFNHEFISY